MNYIRIKRKLFILSLLILLFSCLICVDEVFCGELKNVMVSNVRNRVFTISWSTDEPERGQVNYGTTTSLGNTAYDVRDELYKGKTHYITIGGLSPNTTYYYDIVSGGTTYDNGGRHYTIKTGLVLTPPIDCDIAYGQVFLNDGSTPAEGAIVYIELKDKDNQGTDGTSQVCSSLVGDTGYWFLNLINVRNKALNSYFDYSASGDRLILKVKYPHCGSLSQKVDTSEDAPALPMVLKNKKSDIDYD